MNTISQHLINGVMSAVNNLPDESLVKYKLAMMSEYEIRALRSHPDVGAGIIRSQFETAMLLAEESNDEKCWGT